MTQSHRATKVFTVETVNACLPLVRAITADLVTLSRDLADRRQRWEMLTRGRDVVPSDPYGEELAQVQQELRRDAHRLHEYERELLDLGAIPQSAAEGLIDFPSIVDGRVIYLCWKYNEPEVLFWHERDAGFAGRQPLTVDSVAPHEGGADDLYRN